MSSRVVDHGQAELRRGGSMFILKEDMFIDLEKTIELCWIVVVVVVIVVVAMYEARVSRKY
jgi:hypothetical protein